MFPFFEQNNKYINVLSHYTVYSYFTSLALLHDASLIKKKSVLSEDFFSLIISKKNVTPADSMRVNEWE